MTDWPSSVWDKRRFPGGIGYCLLIEWIGKRIVQLQASLALVQNPEAVNVAVKTDSHGRTPFSHPALDGLRSLSSETKSFLTDRSKLAELAQKYEMQNVLRWTPRKVRYCPVVHIFLSPLANLLCLLAR
jgi:large subunit ribosomal protein L15